MRRIYFVISLLSIFLVSLIGTAYYFWLKLNLTPVTSVSNSVLVPSPKFGKITNGEKFSTTDKSFQLRYPQGWFVTQNRKGLLNLSGESLVESWSLTSFKSPGKTTLPSGGIKLNLEIWTDTAGFSLDDLFACGGDSNLECNSREINGNLYRRIINQITEDKENIMYVTIRNRKIYYFSADYLIEDKESSLSKIEGIVNTFYFLT